MKNILIILFMITFFVSSCSKAPVKSEAKFKIGISAITDISAVGAGGAMLWGRSDKGDMFGQPITPTSPIDLTLQNGSWSFWAVAWAGDATGDKFAGMVRCAKAGALLNGTDVQVNLNLTNSTSPLRISHQKQVLLSVALLSSRILSIMNVKNFLTIMELVAVQRL